MKKIGLIFNFIIFSISFSFAQISEGGLPYSWLESISKPAPKATILTKIAMQKSTETKSEKYGALIFAEVIDFNKSSEVAGEWTMLNNGDRLWRIRLKSEGAYSLNFTFSRYLIPDGAQVFVYSPDKKYKLGAFTSKNNKSYGTLAVAPIPGDEIIIEYYEPEDVTFKGELSIGTIGHDFLNIFGLKDGQFRASGDCNIDINCAEGKDWQAIKRSVVRIISNNRGLCSGTLINNSLNDEKPYLLTAFHCFEDGKTPENSVFYFNYESPECGGIDGSIEQTISGAEYVAYKNKNQGFLDFALIELSDYVPQNYKPYFAGWDSRENAPEKTVCIHHPWGDVKKITRDLDAPITATYVGYGYDPDSFWRINYWDDGTTEGGSSGSSLFNENGRIVGTLTGGEASCATDSCDYFQKFSASFKKYNVDTLQLKHWLDPTNSGLAFMDGLDTYKGIKSIGDLISVAHWEEGQNLAFWLVDEKGTAKDGYLAGNNLYQDKAKAEFFAKNEFGDRNAVTGANIAFVYATGNNDALIELQVLQDDGGTPGKLLGSAFAKLGDIKKVADKDYVYYKYDPPISVSGSIYLSVVLPQNAGDTVAIMTVEEAPVNTAWEYNYYEQWLPYSNPDLSWGKSLSHLITLEIGSFTGLSSKTVLESTINLFPNPVQSELHIDLGETAHLEYLTIYDTYGRLVYTDNIQHSQQSFSINISDLNSGFYVLVLKGSDTVVSKKFIKQ